MQVQTDIYSKKIPQIKEQHQKVPQGKNFIWAMGMEEWLDLKDYLEAN